MFLRRTGVIKMYKVLSVALFAVMLSGCGTVTDWKKEYLPDEKKVDYKKAKAENQLELPPDLINSSIDEGLVIPDIAPTGGAASLSDYTAERSTPRRASSTAVLPEQPDISVQRDDGTRWLVIKGSPQAVWPKVREFWLQNGFLIKREDPRIGILETDWAENRADIKSDFITNFFRSTFDSLYSAATRDKFRVRLERGVEPGTTELFLTHRGAEEVVNESTGSGTIWKPRESDPELEVEMLRRITVFFGVEENKSRTLFARQASRVERAQLVRSGDGIASLTVKEGFARAWRRTGLALDRVGFTVEDRDRSRGVYYVRYIDPLKDSNKKKESGILDKLTFNLFSNDDEVDDKNTYLVNLVESGDETTVTVLNEQGERENSDTAYRILTLLHEQLK
jgi:outer membrane protein assembly factor BamC